MPLLILDALFEERIVAERRALGLDRFDEVWDGVYVIAPIADSEHQFVTGELAVTLGTICREPFGADVFAGCNVSDRKIDWTSNYRWPDVAVFFAANPAQDMETHWFGGPDFAVEVSSDKDRTWDKLDFYAKVKTRELLIIDRNPWKLSLLRLNGEQMELVATSSLEDSAAVASAVIPISLRLLARTGLKPTIQVQHSDGRSWVVDPIL